MLTSDLLRVRRSKKDGLKPIYLDILLPEARRRARELVEIFSSHVGQPRRVIEDAVSDAVGHGTDFLIWRGLAKLLYDRCEFSVDAPLDPQEVRRVVFEEAASAGAPTSDAQRAQVLERAASRLELSAEVIDRALYADLEERQILSSFKVLKPAALLNRYNVALAQAVLYKATQLEIELRDRDPKRLRFLFHQLKFFHLMHTIVEGEGSTLKLIIDGPASVITQSRSYGLQMAKFLPALVLTRAWRLKAQLAWESATSVADEFFELSSRDGLVSHYRARAQWKSDAEVMLESRFETGKTGGWALKPLGVLLRTPEGQVVVPDYVMEHEDGSQVYVELLGFWRAQYLQSRLEMIEAQGWPLLVLVGERMRAERGKSAASEHPHVIMFKGVVKLESLVSAADRFRESGALPVAKSAPKRRGRKKKEA